MSFGSPIFLLLLLGPVAIAAASLHARRRRRAADIAYGGATELRRRMRRGVRTLRASLTFLALVLIVVAAARPRWGTAAQPLTRTGIDVMIALDVSRSMLATDVAPSRAEAAAAAIHAILPYLQQDRVGLVTFGATAFPRSPLTTDLTAFDYIASRAQREAALVQPGTDMGVGINEALQLLDVKDRARTQVIVVMSDGEDLGGTLESALAHARSRGVRLDAVVVGTSEGASIPLPQGTPDGQADPELVTRANPGLMRHIADAGGGEFRTVAAMPTLAASFARLQQTEFEHEAQSGKREHFEWFLAPAVALLVLQLFLLEARRVGGARVRRRESLALPRMRGEVE